MYHIITIYHILHTIYCIPLLPYRIYHVHVVFGAPRYGPAASDADDRSYRAKGRCHAAPATIEGVDRREPDPCKQRIVWYGIVWCSIVRNGIV